MKMIPITAMGTMITIIDIMTMMMENIGIAMISMATVMESMGIMAVSMAVGIMVAESTIDSLQ
ncbi:MAG: hypothetical protein AB7H48_03240 [Parachlamydiales bacterium]